MDIYSMSRDYRKKDEIDFFESAIWTERYYGDGDCELKIPADPVLIQKILPGQLLGCIDSEQPMIVEDHDITGGICTAKGISLMQWMDNRFIRDSPNNQETEAKFPMFTPGQAISIAVQFWLQTGGLYLTDISVLPGDSWPGAPGNPGSSMGISHASKFVIPGLIDWGYPNQNIYGGDYPAVPDLAFAYGPFYSSILPVATKYQIGLKIIRYYNEIDPPSLRFYAYVGVHRGNYPTAAGRRIKFSPASDNLTDVKELNSIADTQTLMFGWGTQIHNSVGMNTTDMGDDPPTTHPDWASTGPQGFDLRAKILLDSSLTDADIELGVSVPLACSNYKGILLEEISELDRTHAPTQIVDGQIVQNSDPQYGVDYGLGDIVILEGFSGIETDGMITEYIRSQDPSGEKAYPTVSQVIPLPT